MKKKKKLEESASRLYPNNKETDDKLGDIIQEYVKKVNNLLEDNTESYQESFSKISTDVMVALAQEDNPFHNFPWVYWCMPHYIRQS